MIFKLVIIIGDKVTGNLEKIGHITIRYRIQLVLIILFPKIVEDQVNTKRQNRE
jgi:sorbitol-specific phosphotransferase system component IIA